LSSRSLVDNGSPSSVDSPEFAQAETAAFAFTRK
jgi:hypothetical protein